jgi:hypothetical protein
LIDRTHIPHPQLSHNENWSFGDLELAIAYQYSLSLVQNTTFGRNEITKKPIVTPGGAEGRIEIIFTCSNFHVLISRLIFISSFAFTLSALLMQIE